jgi:hypothetical protein
LFDLQADPDETSNLIDDPHQTAVVDRLQHLMQVAVEGQ